MKFLIKNYFILLQLSLIVFNKNLNIDETILLSIVIWLNYYLFRMSKFNIKSPLILFGAIFNICNIVHVIYLANGLNFQIEYVSVYGMYFSRQVFKIALVYNLLAITFICVGAKLVIGKKIICNKVLIQNVASYKFRNHEKIYNCSTLQKKILNNSNVFIVVGIICFAVYLYSYGGVNQFFSNLWYIRNGEVESSSGILQIIGQFRNIFNLGLFIKLSKGLDDKNTKNKCKLLVLVIIGFIIAFSSGGRFTTAFVFVQLFLVTYKKNKISINNYKYILGFILIVMIFFPIKWSLFRFLEGKITFAQLVEIYRVNSEGMYRGLLGDHMGSFSALLILIENGRVYGNTLLLKPIINLVSIIIPRRFLIGTPFEYRSVFGYYNEIINYDRYILGEFHFNFIGYFYIIAGVIGVVLLSLLLGIFLGNLYKKYVVKSTQVYPIYVCFYSSLIFMIGMNGSFDPYLRSLFYNIIGLGISLVIIIVKDSLENNLNKRCC